MSNAETLQLANVAKTVINPATEEKQDDLIAEMELKADLTDTQPVSAASLPLPAGAATSVKQDEIIALLEANKFYDTGNSTSTPLGISGNFKGDWIDTTNFVQAVIEVSTDEDAATDGMLFEYSSTGIADEVDHWHAFTPLDNDATGGHHYPTTLDTQYFRINYTNGLVAQTAFTINCTLFKNASEEGHVHAVDYVIDRDHPAPVVRSVLVALSDAGPYGNIGSTYDQNIKTANAEDHLAIARGNVTGVSGIDKFGRGADIDTVDGLVDLWDGSEYNAALKTYTYSTTADIDRISSSDNTDTQELKISGLDTDYNLVIQTKTLTGQTPVALDTSLIRVYRVENQGATDNAGNIFCFVNVAVTLGVPNTITNIRALILPGNNQTLMTHYTVPNATTGYMTDFHMSLSSRKASFANIELRARETGGVFKLKHTDTMASTGSSFLPVEFLIPKTFAAKTDIKFTADSDVNDNAISAAYNLILVEDGF